MKAVLAVSGNTRALGTREAWLRLFASIAAGGLLPLCLAPFGWWWLGLVSVAALYRLLDGGTAATVFWRSFGFGLGLFGVGSSWVYVSIHVHGHASPPLAAMLTALFSITLAFTFALPFILYAWLRRRGVAAPLFLFPSIWVLGEWFRGWFLTGFPWLYLGYSHTDTWLAGWAPVCGVLGLSWLTAVLAVALIEGWSISCRRRMPITLLWVLLVVGFGGWGLRQIPWTQAAGKPIAVSLVQPDIPLEHKWDSAGLSAIMEKLLILTAPHWQSDLIIWPESAIPRLREYVSEYFAYLDEQANQRQVAFITGVPTRHNQQIFNSVVALGTARGTYHKRHLVPFGEYVPLETWLRGMIDFFDLPMSAFSSGPGEQSPITVAGHAIGTLICYEIVFPDLTAETARETQLLLTLSNDTWFGASIGPHQHLQMARMRAIETRKPLLRATNDGITATIDAHGQIIHQLPQFQAGVLESAITPRTGSTPFTRTGSLPILMLSLLCLLHQGWRRRSATPTAVASDAPGR